MIMDVVALIFAAFATSAAQPKQLDPYFDTVDLSARYTIPKGAGQGTGNGDGQFYWCREKAPEVLNGEFRCTILTPDGRIISDGTYKFKGERGVRLDSPPVNPSATKLYEIKYDSGTFHQIFLNQYGHLAPHGDVFVSLQAGERLRFNFEDGNLVEVASYGTVLISKKKK